MNYLKEILAFNNFASMNSLSAGQISLWYALMFFNNKSAWIGEFTVPMALLAQQSGLSPSGIKKARAVLAGHGLIEYTPQGTTATLYKLNPFTIEKAAAESSQSGVQYSSQSGVQYSSQDGSRDGVALNKYKYKQKQNINNYNKNIKKAPLNNYEDTNKTDYAALEEKILDMMLEGV